MASLLGRSPKDSFKELLTINDNGGLGAALHELGDGKGSISPLSLSLTQISLNGVTWPTAAIEGAYLRVGTSNQLEWAALTTSDVVEGANLYFTVSRGRALFSGVGDISVNPDTGEISYTGSGGQGEKGDDGAQGPQGIPGEQGIQGPAGADGLKGDPGEKGEKGDPGADGAPGPAGAAGEQGVQGEAGADGETGPQGVPGNDGAVGPAGNDGAPGAAGRDGIDGAMGPQGLPGEKGEQGIPGLKGDTGADGAQGPQGIQGEQGEIGPPGTTTGSSDQDFAADTLTANAANITGDVNIGGNLFVTGTVNKVESSVTTTTNTTFTLNDGEVGNGVTAGVSGILVDRGTASEGRLVFDEAAGGWKIGTAAVSGLVATQPWVTANTVPTTHIGSGGSAHANATTANAGFMSSADKAKLDGMVTGISQATADARYLQLTGGTVTGTLTVTAPIQGNINGTATNVTGVVGLANGGTGVNATSAAQLVTALGAATLASPVFTGTPKAPTAGATDNSTQIATTAWVQGQAYLKSGGTVANATNASTAASVPWSGVTSKPTTLAGYGITDKVALVTATNKQIPYSNGTAYIGSNEFTFTTGIGAGPGAGYSANTLNIGTAGALYADINLGFAAGGQFGLGTIGTITSGQAVVINASRNDGTATVNLRVTGTDRLVVTNTGATVTGTMTATSFTGPGTGLTGTAANLTAGTANAVTWANISGKPTTFAGYGVTAGSLTSLTVTNPITGSITGTAGSVQWANVLSKPTTLAGYGITDANSSTAIQPIARGGTGSTTAAGALIQLGAAPSASPSLSGTPTAPTAVATDRSNQIATTSYVKNQNYISARDTAQQAQYNIPFYDANGKQQTSTNFAFVGGQSGAGPGGNFSPSTLNIGATNGWASTINMYSNYTSSTVNSNSGLILNAGANWAQIQYQGTVMGQADSTGFRVPNGTLTVVNNIVAGGTITATGGFNGNFTGTLTGNITGNAAGLSATLPIAKGGTGATTATAGLAALNGLPLTGGTLTGALYSNSAIQTSGLITAGTGVSGGFQNASYAAGRNNIWRFADSASYGMSYFQGSGGKKGSDSIGIHFGNASATGSLFSFNSADGSFDAAIFNGAGTGLTGTAANLTAGNATKLATARTIAGVAFDGTANISIPIANITGAAPLASPAFTGTPTAPTAATADSSTAVATTAFVKAQAYAPLASPTLTGTPLAPTATAGTNTTQIATTAFVTAAIAAGGSSSGDFKKDGTVAMTGKMQLAAGTTSLAPMAFAAGAYLTTPVAHAVEWNGTALSITNASAVRKTVAFTDGIPYDMAGSILGKPAANAVVLRFVAVRAFTIPAAMAGSLSKSSTAATASTVLSFQKNGSQFGTLTYAAAGTTGTFAAASATSFAAGDVLTVVAPGTQDATFGDCEYTIVATLS